MIIKVNINHINKLKTELKSIFRIKDHIDFNSLMYVMMIAGSDIIFTLAVIIFYSIDAAVLNF